MKVESRGAGSNQRPTSGNEQLPTAILIDLLEVEQLDRKGPELRRCSLAIDDDVAKTRAVKKLSARRVSSCGKFGGHRLPLAERKQGGEHGDLQVRALASLRHSRQVTTNERLAMHRLKELR